MWVWDENWAEIIEESIDAWTAEYCGGASVDLQVQRGASTEPAADERPGRDLPDIVQYVAGPLLLLRW